MGNIAFETGVGTLDTSNNARTQAAHSNSILLFNVGAYGQSSLDNTSAV